MQLLLSRSLWDTYACHADDLVNDFVSLTSLVTKESLQALEATYNQSQGITMGFSFPQMQAAASRFLGRLWAGPNATYHVSGKSVTLNPGTMGSSRPSSTVRRSPSKQSMASTLNSIESTSEASTAITDVSVSSSGGSELPKLRVSPNQDKDLHGQIEDLLMALSDLQREQADLARELQREREEREGDHQLAKSMLRYIRELSSDSSPVDLVAQAEERFSATSKRVSIIQTKHQLRDDLNRWREKHTLEAERCIDLGRRIDEHEKENIRLKEELREARNRIQDSHREKQRLEKTVQELRARRNPSPETSQEGTSSSPGEPADCWPGPGLRKIKLVNRATTQKNNWPKRTSSLGLQAINSPDNNSSAPASEEGLLQELVNAKTAEAVAKQELEEVKSKLDSLRRLIGSPNSAMTRTSSSVDSNPVMVVLPPLGGGTVKTPDQTKSNTPTPYSGAGGFFSGWAKRSVSTSSATLPDPK